MEFRELNQSFSAVGAFRTAESNLTANDRPLRVRTALVDEHLFAPLACRPRKGVCSLGGRGHRSSTGAGTAGSSAGSSDAAHRRALP